MLQIPTAASRSWTKQFMSSGLQSGASAGSLLCQVDDSRELFPAREIVNRAEESLQAVEPLLSFHPEQIVSVQLPRPTPSVRHHRRVVADILLADEPKA